MERNIFLAAADECFNKRLYQNWTVARGTKNFRAYKCEICNGIHRSGSSSYVKSRREKVKF